MSILYYYTLFTAISQERKSRQNEKEASVSVNSYADRSGCTADNYPCVLSSANEPQRPVTIIYRNTEYAYKEFLAGCVLSCLKTLDEPPADDESEGINAVAVALDCSLRYLHRAGKSFDSGYPYVEYIDEKESIQHFGAETGIYRKYAENSAEYAISLNLTVQEGTAFLPVCRISSGITISPEDSGNPLVKSCIAKRTNRLNTITAPVSLRQTE